MGHVLKELAKQPLEGTPVFHKRFVVELCETVHVHYRNLRINLSLCDFQSMAEGMADALARWAAMGSPEPNKDKHIELCRKPVATMPQGPEEIKVSLNTNLYNHNQGRIFAEGANLTEPVYAHLKVRDLRLELTLDEFHQLQHAVLEASKHLNSDAYQPEEAPAT